MNSRTMLKRELEEVRECVQGIYRHNPQFTAKLTESLKNKSGNGNIGAAITYIMDMSQ